MDIEVDNSGAGQEEERDCEQVIFLQSPVHQGKLEAGPHRVS